MALNGTTLGNAIAGAVGGLSEEDKKVLATVWQTIATEIVNHIKANAQLSVPGAGITAPNGPCGGTSTTGTVT